MACRTPADNVVDANAIALVKKTAELKKKLLLAEGQKKAYLGDWAQREKQNADTLVDLKKDIKLLTGKVMQLNNEARMRRPSKSAASSKASHQSAIKEVVVYPVGAKDAEDAVHIYDSKLIQLVKQRDLLNEKYAKRKATFDRLYVQYQKLQVYQKTPDSNGDPPPTSTAADASTTEEEAANRKQICRLENEIHRTNVQWMEAEHIRKKYRSIQGSLRADAEKFERALQGLEVSMTEQQADINRIQEINHEALQMRDSTKIVLMRQEHSAHVSAKSRERQAFDFRRQVDERKVELERLERKLFSTGKPLVHQGSVESLNGSDPLSGKKPPVRQDSNARAQEATSSLEQLFKQLMEMTGATSALEVLERFLGQKESTSRLNYLRTVTESEKKHLEIQREMLNSQLEAIKFSTDVKENEENQEEVEQLKTNIAIEAERTGQCELAIEHTGQVIDSIKSSLLDLILKLQEVDEVIDPPSLVHRTDEVPFELADLLTGNASDELLLQILEDKIKKGLAWSGETFGDPDSEVTTDDARAIGSSPNGDDLDVPIPSLSDGTTPRPPTSMLDEKERPLAFPACYSSLLVGRATGQMSSASPGQLSQSVATDDEAEVPTRGYLKRQAQYIVDAKSRRKGFRAPRR